MEIRVFDVMYLFTFFDVKFFNVLVHKVQTQNLKKSQSSYSYNQINVMFKMLSSIMMVWLLLIKK